MAPARETGHPGLRRTAPPGGNRKRTAFPRPRTMVPCRPAGPGTAEASARPGGREAPAGGGAGAGRGLWPPAGPDIGAALRQGRWPLPGCAKRAQANEVPALWSGSPCGRHSFSTRLVKYLTFAACPGWMTAWPQTRQAASTRGIAPKAAALALSPGHHRFYKKAPALDTSRGCVAFFHQGSPQDVGTFRAVFVGHGD